jgi:hypothetical protein
METDGRVYGPVVPQVIVPIPEPDIEDIGADRDPPSDGSGLSASADWGNGKYSEQKESGGPQAAIAGPIGPDPDAVGAAHLFETTLSVNGESSRYRIRGKRARTSMKEAVAVALPVRGEGGTKNRAAGANSKDRVRRSPNDAPRTSEIDTPVATPPGFR